MSIFPVASDSVTLDTAQVETTDVWANGFRINPVTGGVRAAFSNTVSTYNQGVPLDSSGVVCLVDSTASFPSATWNNGIPLSNQKVCLSSAASSTYSNGLPMAANGGLGGLLVPSMSLYFLSTASLDSRITFARADAVTCATYFDSTGRMQRMGRNELLYSATNNAVYGVVGTATKTANYAGAPDGTVTASRLQTLAAADAVRYYATTSAATYTVSMYVASTSASSQNFQIRIFDNVGQQVSGTKVATTAWQRFSFTVVANAGANFQIDLQSITGSAAIDVLTWGWQLELGSTATAYSATTTAANSGPRFDYDPASPAGVTGPELVTNGDFSQGSTGWTASPGTQVSQLSGSAWRIASTDGSAASVAQTALTPTAGKTYRITLEIVSTSGSGLLVDFGGATSPALTTIGVKTFDLKCSNTVALVVKRGGVCDSVFDNISVQEVTFTPRGLLIEESRQNLLLQSRDMTQAAWTKTDVTPARTQVGIDGVANTACLITEGVATSSHLVSQTATVTVGPVAISVVAKAGTRSFIALYEGVLGKGKFFNLSAGTVGGNLVSAPDSAAIQSLGGGWYRCSIVVTTATTTASPAVYLSPDGVAFSYTGTGGTVTLDCAQLEVGAFATSIIPTTTTALTRAADSASMTGTNFSSWFNASQGTIYAEVSGIPSGVTGRPYTVCAGTGTAEMLSTEFTVYRVRTGSVDVLSYNGPVPNGKVALAYQSANHAVSKDGALSATSSTAGVPVGLDNIKLGTNQAGTANYLNGWLRSLRYYPTRLANAQLQALTA